jgi:hypothetical protein
VSENLIRFAPQYVRHGDVVVEERRCIKNHQVGGSAIKEHGTWFAELRQQALWHVGNGLGATILIIEGNLTRHPKGI